MPALNHLHFSGARRRWLAAVALVVATAIPTVPTGATAEPGQATAATTEAVQSSNRFGFDLYQQITGRQQNIICSPASAAIALSMTAAGAAGETLAEMSHVLHFDRARLPETHRSFARLLAILNQRDGRDGVKLQLTDRLWAQQGMPVRATFHKLLQAEYGAPLSLVDFARTPEAARIFINRWAEEATRNRIKDALGPGSVNADTRLIVTNAIYFKGRWTAPFARSKTTGRLFHTPGGTRMTPTMRRTASFRVAKADGLSLIALPYHGDLAMVVLLPDAMQGLPAIERRLATEYEGWCTALNAQEPRPVDLQLPRWHGKTNLALGEPLSALGMSLAFSGDADFTAMLDGGPRLKLQQVFQQAFIDVDELGTEAAAVTHVELGKAGKAAVPPIPFHVDHPFLFLIVDQETEIVLFLGRVLDPTAR